MIVLKGSITFMILVLILEFLHVMAALCGIPLYTKAELNASYMHLVNRHSDVQIIFTYIFAWTGILLAIMNIYITYHLVHACQDLHSNVHLVLGYDQ